MKINIEKLPSGNYRIRKTVRGQTYRLQLDYRPTQREALELLSAMMKDGGSKPTNRIKFTEAAARYIDSVDGVLSPSTVREYTRTVEQLRTLYPRFCGLRICDISGADIQRVINHFSKGQTPHGKPRSPKSVSNLYGVIRSVMRAERPDFAPSVALPPKKKTEAHIPTDAEVKAVYEALRGSKCEIPFRLACLGLRRSEICGLSEEDLDGNVLYIHRAKVMSTEGWKTSDRTKTPESTRKILLPDDLADLIRERGLFSGHPGELTRHMHIVQDKLGIPRFSAHKLRHYYASTAHALGVPDVYIMAAGGWRTDNVLKSVYRHALDDKRTEMDKRTLDHLATILE